VETLITYYPFGLKHEYYNTQERKVKYKEQNTSKRAIKQALTDEVKFKYKYNGKELQDELGLQWYDYGAWNYDPALGRFMNLDSLTEKYNTQSPYVYADNNPVLLMDILGMGTEEQDWIDNGDGTYTAEKGDSAATLAKDADISYKEANELVQMQHGANKKNANGNEYSNIKEGDVVVVPSKVVEKINEKETMQNKIEAKNEKIDKQIAKNNEISDSVSKRNKNYNKQIEMPKNTWSSKAPGDGGLKSGGKVFSHSLERNIIAPMERKVKKNEEKIDSLKKLNIKLENKKQIQ